MSVRWTLEGATGAMATRVARRLLLVLAIVTSARGCTAGGALRGSSLVDHVLEDDSPASPLVRAEDASAPANVTTGDDVDRAPGVGEDGCTFDLPTAENPANDLNFCPGVGGGARCPDSKPSRCAPGCEDRGTCNQELGRCDCPRGMHGDACELGQLERFDVPETHRDDPPLCYNDCSGRGECVEGFCRCLPGFFGSDCAVYLDDAGAPRLAPDTPWRGHRPSPKVYVYHLPPRFNQHFDTRKLDRPTEIFFFERVSSSHHRTADPDDADLFLVHVTPRLIAGGGGKALYIDAIKYVDETWPERTRRNGWRDHLFFFAGDWGPCDFFRNAAGPERDGWPDALVNGIVLSHWGLKKRRKEYQGGGPCFYPEKDVLLPPIQSPQGVNLYSPYAPFALGSPPGNESAAMWKSKLRNPAATPGATDGGGALTIVKEPANDDGPVVETSRALVNVVNPVRRWLLYFAGATVKPSTGYAVRRLLADALRGREAEGIRVVERDEDHYFQNLAASTFCLAPTGTGWGRRVGLAAQFGCVPVIVQDSVRQAFDDVLPYDAFTVRIEESDIPNIPDLLRAIPESCEGVPPGGRCLERMRAQLACAIRALTWSSVYGSLFGESGADDAFAFTMLSLQHRLATYVKPEGRARHPWTPEVPMRNACAMVETLSCVRVRTPLCRNPCETTVRASPREKLLDRTASMIWPAGGAVCRDPNAVPEGGNICANANPPPRNTSEK